jgi:hypothetical protein
LTEETEVEAEVEVEATVEEAAEVAAPRKEGMEAKDINEKVLVEAEIARRKEEEETIHPVVEASLKRGEILHNSVISASDGILSSKKVQLKGNNS